MKENAKIQYGGNKTPSISLLKSDKPHVLLHISTYMLRVNTFLVCKVYILLFRLFIRVLYSFTHTFSTFYIRLLYFTHTVCSTVWIFYLGIFWWDVLTYNQVGMNDEGVMESFQLHPQLMIKFLREIGFDEKLIFHF